MARGRELTEDPMHPAVAPAPEAAGVRRRFRSWRRTRAICARSCMTASAGSLMWVTHRR